LQNNNDDPNPHARHSQDEADPSQEPTGGRRVLPPRLAGATRSPSGVLVDDRGLIAQDVACRGCAYNLYGVNQNDACPQCGAVAGWVLVADRLRFSKPQWVGQLSAGAGWLIASVFLSVFLVGMSAVIELAPGADRFDRLLTVFRVAPNFFWMYALWLVTSPEPTEVAYGPLKLRVVTRWFTVAPLFVETMVVIVLGENRDEELLIAAGGIAIIYTIASLIGGFAIYLYAQHLALRLPDKPLAEQTSSLLWMNIGFFVYVVVIMAVFWIDTLRGRIIGPLGIEAIKWFIALPALVLAIWSFVLLFRYRKRLKEAASQAALCWPAGPRRCDFEM